MPDKTTFTSGGINIDTEAFHPKAPNGGVIVLAYGSDGMVDNAHGAWASMLRDYAEELSREGFVAIIPDYFHRTNTQAGSIDYEQGGDKIVRTNVDKWTSTFGEAIVHAKSLKGVDPKRVGLLGFSLGGNLCLRQRSQATVLVAFFAPRLDGAGLRANPGLRVQIHHGRSDSLVPFEDNANPTKQALLSEGASVDVQEYKGAGHGFVGNDAANTAARTKSKAETVKFFKSNL